MNIEPDFGIDDGEEMIELYKFPSKASCCIKERIINMMKWDDLYLKITFKVFQSCRR